MKKLLFSGIAAVTLMAAGTAQAGGLNLTGETGLARTPLAMALAPMQVAIAADYVNSGNYQVPMRAEIGLPYGVELGGMYNYVASDADITAWSLNAKWVLPEFAPGLGLAIGGHFNQEEVESFENDGHDLYGVASYSVPMGEGMAIVPSLGVKWQSITGDNDKDDWRFFGSLLFKAPMFAIGGEYLAEAEDLDGFTDASYWIGGRFFLNPMVTLQAGYLNNANIDYDDFEDDFSDGVFHVGAQFAFGGAK